MNAYDQKKAQLQLIKAIRQQLPVGYTVVRWDDQLCITHDARSGDADSQVRQFVSNAEEWEKLKPTLGRHSAEVLALLKTYGERVGGDLSTYLVYGSPMRPMIALWAPIDGAVYMQVDKAVTGYHTYIASPLTLSKDAVERYELVFVSR